MRRRMPRARARTLPFQNWGTGTLVIILPLLALSLLAVGYRQLAAPTGHGGGVSLMAIDADVNASAVPAARPETVAATVAPIAPVTPTVEAPAAPESVAPAQPAAAPAPVTEPAPAAAEPPAAVEARSEAPAGPTFNGRPLRPVRQLNMVVTAYSPDERSCGKWADGVTASGYSVWTNGMKLVAADTRLLPFGTIVSVPGYNDGKPVQVLDRGGAIKGHRLDVLYPTHEIALDWGVRRLDVTVWEYAD